MIWVSFLSPLGLYMNLNKSLPGKTESDKLDTGQWRVHYVMTILSRTSKGHFTYGRSMNRVIQRLSSRNKHGRHAFVVEGVRHSSSYYTVRLKHVVNEKLMKKKLLCRQLSVSFKISATMREGPPT